MPTDPLQDELVRRAMARDAASTISPIDPRTKTVPMQREDPFMGKELLQSWAENLSDPSNIGGPAPGSLEAVAVGGPAMIPILKQRGAKLVEQIAAEGMIPRSSGIKLVGAEGEALNERAMKALQYFQQRYPRLFGHLADVTPIDKMVEQGHRGRSVAAEGIESLVGGARPGEYHKISRIELNPYTATPETVGHEMLHAADRLTMKDFPERYAHSLGLPAEYVPVGPARTVPTMPGKLVQPHRVVTPYEASSYEIRARNAGDSFMKKLVDAGIFPAPSGPGPTVYSGQRDVLSKFFAEHPEMVPTKAPSAVYKGEQEGLGPLYDIVGGPSHGSTVSADTLRKMGIPVPAKPWFKKK